MWSGSPRRGRLDGAPTPLRRARGARAVAVVACAFGAVAVLGCSSDTTASDLSDPAGPTGQVASPGAPVDERGPARKVTVAGDSISVGLGSALREELGDDVTVKVIGEVGTGLARPDDFDWPERLRELARDYPPDVLVLSLSSNDAQDLVDADGDVVATRSNDDAWDLEYASRLAEAFDAFEHTGTTVLWVGHVRTEKDKVGLTNRHIHRLAEQVASTRPWVEVRDLATILGSGEQVADECLVADGLHLRTDCLELAAHELAVAEPIS